MCPDMPNGAPTLNCEVDASKLRSNSAKHAHEELTRFLAHKVKEAQDPSMDIDVTWAKSMLESFPAAIDIIAYHGVTANHIAMTMSIDILTDLLNGKPITPLQGVDVALDEWNDVSESFRRPAFQSRRCPSVFYYPDQKAYYDCDRNYYNTVPTGVSFSGQMFSDEAIRIFGAWVNGPREGCDEETIFKYLPNAIKGNKNVRVEMPYMPPARKYYDVDWVAEIFAYTMCKAAYHATNMMESKTQAPISSLGSFGYIPDNIKYGVYRMPDQRDLFPFITFDVRYPGAPDVARTTLGCAIRVPREDLEDISLDEYTEFRHSVENTMRIFADYLRHRISKGGPDTPMIYLPPADEDGDRWLLLSNMVQPQSHIAETVTAMRSVCDTILPSIKAGLTARDHFTWHETWNSEFTENDPILHKNPVLLALVRRARKLHQAAEERKAQYRAKIAAQSEDPAE